MDVKQRWIDRHLGSFALSLCWPTFASERIIAPSFECRLFVIFYIVHPETDQLNNYPSTPMTKSCRTRSLSNSYPVGELFMFCKRRYCSPERGKGPEEG
ncbi:hypothetical protein T03_13592 [Trichinella britovi]|uniref:Uncharacterized protein n=2 Tax=Trichinella TaxID=6333 RepID=A0A0V1CGB9_TRIBR|nr:hypothetical protein T05_15797 [Trichinella murrelli]KRY48356.1 hypothetical protein T03_13592 [Trichinella britovi]